MSKSRGNVVNPDEYIKKFGADALRLYVMFLGPMDGSPDFRDSGIEGMERFVNRVWDVFQEYADNTSQTMSPEVLTQMHKTVQKVTKDIEAFRYNTAIATIMEYTNLLSAAVKEGKASKEALQTLVQLIAPFAPHMAEEVWREIFAEETSVHISPWPTFDPEKTVDSQIVIPVQVNGKLRAQLTIDADNTNEEEIVRLARELDQIQKWVTSEPRKVIYIQGKLLNFVV
jgi:leucyl-tRNA synthetase